MHQIDPTLTHWMVEGELSHISGWASIHFGISAKMKHRAIDGAILIETVDAARSAKPFVHASTMMNKVVEMADAYGAAIVIRPPAELRDLCPLLGFKANPGDPSTMTRIPADAPRSKR